MSYYLHKKGTDNLDRVICYQKLSKDNINEIENFISVQTCPKETGIGNELASWIIIKCKEKGIEANKLTGFLQELFASFNTRTEYFLHYQYERTNEGEKFGLLTISKKCMMHLKKGLLITVVIILTGSLKYFDPKTNSNTIDNTNFKDAYDIEHKCSEGTTIFQIHEDALILTRIEDCSKDENCGRIIFFYAGHGDQNGLIWNNQIQIHYNDMVQSLNDKCNHEKEYLFIFDCCHVGNCLQQLSEYIKIKVISASSVNETEKNNGKNGFLTSILCKICDLHYMKINDLFDPINFLRAWQSFLEIYDLLRRNNFSRLFQIHPEFYLYEIRSNNDYKRQLALLKNDPDYKTMKIKEDQMKFQSILGEKLAYVFLTFLAFLENENSELINETPTASQIPIP